MASRRAASTNEMRRRRLKRSQRPRISPLRGLETYDYSVADTLYPVCRIPIGPTVPASGDHTSLFLFLRYIILNLRCRDTFWHTLKVKRILGGG